MHATKHTRTRPLSLPLGEFVKRKRYLTEKRSQETRLLPHIRFWISAPRVCCLQVRDGASSSEVVSEARAEGGPEQGAHPDAGAEGQRGQLQGSTTGGPRQLRQRSESSRFLLCSSKVKFSQNELSTSFWHFPDVVPVLELPAPPDGGWGWVIVFASFMCNLIIDGIAYREGAQEEDD